nr:TetR/AcrR family transcriptional regulator [Plantibacter sp. VKM Ac-2885]
MLQTAAELISADGYAESSLVKIAAESGSAPGSLAFFFATKQGVAEDVIAGGVALIEQAVRERTDAVFDPVSRLVIGTITVSELLEREPMVRAMVRLLTEEPLFAEQWDAHHGRTMGLVRSHVARAVQSGELPTIDEEATASLIVTIMTGIASAVRGGDAQPGSGAKSLAAFWKMCLGDERFFELESHLSQLS